MEKSRNVNYPGMFDLLKGIVMIGIILTHIKSVIPAGAQYGGELSFLKKAVFALPEILSLGNATIPMLFLISGYGFTSINMKKCLKKQSKQLLRPYLFTGIAVAVVHFVCHFCAFRYLPGAVNQTGVVFLSHILGLQNGFQFRGIQFCCIGSVWFLMALFEGWVLLTAVMNYLPKQSRGVIAVCFFILSGLVFTLAPPWIVYSFCFGSLFLCCCNLYWGALLKLHNWLWVPLPLIAWFLLVPLAVISQLAYFFSPTFSAPPMAQIVFSLIYSVGVECSAFLLMRVAVRLNRCQNWLLDKIRIIGRYSIWVICAHTIESQGLLWYLFVDRMKGHEFAAFLIMIIVRGGLIFALCYLFCQVDRKLRRIRRQRRVAGNL